MPHPTAVNWVQLMAFVFTSTERSRPELWGPRDTRGQRAFGSLYPPPSRGRRDTRAGWTFAWELAKGEKAWEAGSGLWESWHLARRRRPEAWSGHSPAQEKGQYKHKTACPLFLTHSQHRNSVSRGKRTHGEGDDTNKWHKRSLHEKNLLFPPLSPAPFAHVSSQPCLEEGGLALLSTYPPIHFHDCFCHQHPHLCLSLPSSGHLAFLWRQLKRCSKC